MSGLTSVLIIIDIFSLFFICFQISDNLEQMQYLSGVGCPDEPENSPVCECEPE